MTEIEFPAKPVDTIRLLPIYILCDTSKSMQTNGAINELNEGLAGVLKAINSQGAKGDDIRLSVITYSTNAVVVLPLTSVEMNTAIPTLEAAGVTNLPQAVELLGDTLSKDYHALRDASERAYRPAVFVFTDGRPTDDMGKELDDPSPWLGPLESLKRHPIWAPRIYAYGFGDAQPSQLELLVSEREVSDSVAKERVTFSGTEAAESIGRLFPHLFKTITEAADAAAGGASEEQIAKALDSAYADKSSGAINPDDWWGDK